MEIFGTILTGLKTLISAIYPPLKKRYFDQPKIYIVLIWQGGNRSPGPLSSKNDFSNPIENTIEIRHDKLKWKYKLALRNNSEHTAYNIKILSPLMINKFLLEPTLDSLRPIIPNTEETYNLTISEIIEATGLETYKASLTHPNSLLTVKFILEYTNVKGTKFYTEFEITKEGDLQNQFYKKLKK